jgi:hypothetical protein
MLMTPSDARAISAALNAGEALRSNNIAAAILRAAVPPEAHRHIRPALDMDADAAIALMRATPRNRYGRLARAFYAAKFPSVYFGPLFVFLWKYSHRAVIAEAGNRRTLETWMRHTASVPADLPDSIRLYRGTAATPFDEARMGVSWTPLRDLACWHAVSSRRPNPLVLAATVPRSVIIAYFDQVAPDLEYIVFDAPGATIDGNPDDWQEGYARHRAVWALHDAEATDG